MASRLMVMTSEEDLSRVLALWTEARAMHNRAEYAQAERLLQQALSLGRSIFGRNDKRLGYVLLDLALVYDAQGRKALSATTRARIFRLQAQEAEAQARRCYRLAESEERIARAHRSKKRQKPQPLHNGKRDNKSNQEANWQPSYEGNPSERL